MVEAQSKTGHRFNEFSKLVEDDLRRITSKIAASVSSSPRRTVSSRV